MSLLTIKDLRCVYKITFNARNKWRKVLLELGLDFPAIERIRRTNDDPDDCYLDGLSVWLEGGDRSWRDLVEALSSHTVRHKDVAEEIERKYLKTQAIGSIPSGGAYRQPITGELVIFTNEQLGAGAFGAVFKGSYRGMPCAVKLLHQLAMRIKTNLPVGQAAEGAVKTFDRECEFLKSFQHPNIVQHLSTEKHPTSGNTILVIELMDCNLRVYFSNISEESLTIDCQLSLSKDVASGLAYIHSKHIIHRDLCGDNVLLKLAQPVPVAKISDFGMSRLLEHSKLTLTAMGHRMGYLPPEASRLEEEQYDSSLDVFSLGVTMVQIVLKLETVKSPRDRLSYVAQIPDTHLLKHLINECSQEDMKRRPSASQVYDKVRLLQQGAKLAEKNSPVLSQKTNMTESAGVEYSPTNQSNLASSSASLSPATVSLAPPIDSTSQQSGTKISELDPKDESSLGSRIRDTLRISRPKKKKGKVKGLAYSGTLVETNMNSSSKYTDPFDTSFAASDSKTGAGQDHDFKPVSIPHNKPEYCDHCGESAWGLYRQVLKCSRCDFIVHRKCEGKVVIDCSVRPAGVPSQDKQNTTSVASNDSRGEDQQAESSTSSNLSSTQMSTEQFMMEKTKLSRKIGEYNRKTTPVHHIHFCRSSEHNDPSLIEYQGFVRLHVCVQRPIHVSTAITRTSWYRLLRPAKERVSNSAEGMNDGFEPTAFYLPTDTTRLVHISNTTTTKELVSAVLKKFCVTDSPKKFTLYEEYGHESRRLLEEDRPLEIVLEGSCAHRNSKLVLRDKISCNDPEDPNADTSNLK